ncbi:hypothetical protein GCM10009696_30160 [Kocuria himachalensis]
MSQPYPVEFRRDVVAVARKHEAPLAQIAKDFGISEATLHSWLRKADVEDGITPGTTDAEAAEIRALKKRMRLLEQENEVMRRAAAYPSQANLANNGLVGSMGRAGPCGDNAAMESFCSLLQNNVLDTRHWVNREDLRQALATWIERTYHRRRRRQRRLGKLTPVEYETITKPAVDLAA